MFKAFGFRSLLLTEARTFYPECCFTKLGTTERQGTLGLCKGLGVGFIADRKSETKKAKKYFEIMRFPAFGNFCMFWS